MSQYAHLSQVDPELPQLPGNADPLPADYIPMVKQMMSNVTVDRTGLPAGTLLLSSNSVRKERGVADIEYWNIRFDLHGAESYDRG